MKIRINQFVGLLLLSTLFISSCKLHSELPTIITENIPVPELESSVIEIPVEVNLQPIINYANSKTDKVIRNPEYPNFTTFEGVEGPRASYDVTRDALTGSMQGNFFKVGTTAAYGIAGDYCSEIVWGKCIHPRIPFSCGTNGEAKRKVKIGFSSKVEITSSYGLKIQTVVSEVTPIDPCKMTFLKIDMTNKIMEAIRPSLNDCAKFIDQQSKSTSFKSIAQDAWKELWTPIEIEGYGFLCINPNEISVSQLNGTGQLLKFNIGLKANPKFTLTKDTALKAPALPALKTNSKSHSEFVFNMPIISSYTDLTNHLKKNFNEKTFKSEDGKQTILIHDLTITGNGNSTIILEMNCDLKIGIKKFKDATLIFTMKPIYDSKTQTLELSNIKLQADKKHILLQAGTELFQKTIAQKIQEFGKTDLKPMLELNKKSISQQLHKQLDKNAKLSGQVNSLKILGIYPTEHNLVIHTQATGVLNLKMSDYSFE
jgi:hypothetical protein